LRRLAQALQVCVLDFSVFVHFLWLLGLLKQHRRPGLAANATAFGLVVQIIVIIVQVVRYNQSLQLVIPQDEALWRFMEIALILLWAATLVTVILLLLERLDTVWRWRCGGFAFLDLHWHGVWVFHDSTWNLSKTRRWWQPATVTYRRAQRGSKDGGPGIPVLYLRYPGR